MNRCGWAESSELMRRYHDEEWGVPCHDERRLFEMLCLEGQQAGLSWDLILRKREGYRKAFHNFDVDAVAALSPEDIDRLMLNPEVVRNRMKLQSVVDNARVVRRLDRTLDDLFWSFVGGKPIVNAWSSPDGIPATSPVSDAMGKALKRLGFKFMGSTTCYALMQACGMVNDHTADCFRRSATTDSSS